jgi:hypothetical protein
MAKGFGSGTWSSNVVPIHNAKEVTIVTDAALTSSAASGNSNGVDVRPYIEGIVLIRSTAITLDPNVDLDIEVLGEDGQWYLHTNVPNFAPSANAVNHTAVAITNFGRQIRLTNPDGVQGTGTITMTATFVGKT